MQRSTDLAVYRVFHGYIDQRAAEIDDRIQFFQQAAFLVAADNAALGMGGNGGGILQNIAARCGKYSKTACTQQSDIAHDDLSADAAVRRQPGLSASESSWVIWVRRSAAFICVTPLSTSIIAKEQMGCKRWAQQKKKTMQRIAFEIIFI